MEIKAYCYNNKCVYVIFLCVLGQGRLSANSTARFQRLRLEAVNEPEGTKYQTARYAYDVLPHAASAEKQVSSNIP